MIAFHDGVMSRADMLKKATPTTPLSLHLELPNGTEAHFIFPFQLKQRHILGALNEIVSLVPMLRERDNRRAELENVLQQLREHDPFKADALFLSEEYRVIAREVRYVYHWEHLRWIDAQSLLRLPEQQTGTEGMKRLTSAKKKIIKRKRRKR